MGDTLSRLQKACLNECDISLDCKITDRGTRRLTTRKNFVHYLELYRGKESDFLEDMFTRDNTCCLLITVDKLFFCLPTSWMMLTSRRATHCICVLGFPLTRSGGTILNQLLHMVWVHFVVPQNYSRENPTYTFTTISSDRALNIAVTYIEIHNKIPKNGS